MLNQGEFDGSQKQQNRVMRVILSCDIFCVRTMLSTLKDYECLTKNLLCNLNFIKWGTIC